MNNQLFTVYLLQTYRGMIGYGPESSMNPIWNPILCYHINHCFISQLKYRNIIRYGQTKIELLS